MILRIIGYKFGKNNYRMLTSIIIVLLGTKMGECNEMRQTLIIKLMMNVKATMQFFRIVINLNHT